jgi:long-chain-fatty-acid--CoA ligase ACSBG
MVHGTHEILMFGRHIFMGYLHDADRTADAIDERGWFHSADIGQADRSAFLYVTGRQKDLVRVASGAAVPPGAIEDTFMVGC